MMLQRINGETFRAFIYGCILCCVLLHLRVSASGLDFCSRHPMIRLQFNLLSGKLECPECVVQNTDLDSLEHEELFNPLLADEPIHPVLISLEQVLSKHKIGLQRVNLPARAENGLLDILRKNEPWADIEATICGYNISVAKEISVQKNYDSERYFIVYLYSPEQGLGSPGSTLIHILPSFERQHVLMLTDDGKMSQAVPLKSIDDILLQLQQGGDADNLDMKLLYYDPRIMTALQPVLQGYLVVFFGCLSERSSPDELSKRSSEQSSTEPSPASFTDSVRRKGHKGSSEKKGRPRRFTEEDFESAYGGMLPVVTPPITSPEPHLGAIRQRSHTLLSADSSGLSSKKSFRSRTKTISASHLHYEVSADEIKELESTLQAEYPGLTQDEALKRFARELSEDESKTWATVKQRERDIATEKASDTAVIFSELPETSAVAGVIQKATDLHNSKSVIRADPERVFSTQRNEAATGI